jgi:hypothetical protein
VSFHDSHVGQEVATHVGIACGKKILLWYYLLDLSALLLGRRRRVGAVLSQSHAGGGSMRPSVAVGSIDDAIGDDGDHRGLMY